MSWAVEEWKEGLSTRVLHKIQELESQLEKLKKERQQRQFQLESLDAALQKQKQKVENEKTEGATLKRENQSLIELCDNLEKTRQKLSHELQVKESQVSFQEGQLTSSKKQIERLEQDLKRYKLELERSQQTPIAGDSSVSSTPQKSLTVPSTPYHSDAKFEELQTKYEKEVEEKKKLEAELKSMKSYLVAAEEKIKRLSEELNCQRQNSESVRRSLEQKIKEKEKEYQAELSCQLDQVRTKLQEELHQAKNNYSRLQVDLEKIGLEKERLEKNASDFTLKLKVADEAMETMRLKGNELRRNLEEVKQQNNFLSCKSGQQSQEICQLKEDLHTAKQILQQSQSLAEEMKSQKWSLERELQVLKDNLNKQDESLEKMQCDVSHLEKQRDSLQQSLHQKENTIEKLSRKLEDLESLENILAECESLKKEVEILSLQKTENEQLLGQFRSEKEGLMSKTCSLENALMMEQIKSNDRVTIVEAENEHLSREIKKLKCVAEERSTELEAQRIAFCELQQKTVTAEEKYQKESQNNSLKLAELSKQVNILQEMLQSAANEAVEKEKCISSLETSLASHVQLNTSSKKQLEELIQVRDEIERKLAEAELKHEGFARESEEHLSKLQVALSEKEDLVAKALAALEEKEKQLQLLIIESKRQGAEIQDLNTSNEMLEDSVQQLKIMPQTASYAKPDLSAARSLSEKEMEGLKDKNVFLQSAIDTSEQKHLSLMETNLHLSNNLKDQDENLSERHREKSTFLLQAQEGLERKCTLLEANSNLECSLRACGCHFEEEKAEFEYREKQLMNEHEEFQCQLLSLEEKNNILLRQLEKMQVILEEAEVVPVQNFLSSEPDSLEPKGPGQKTTQQHYNTLLQENRQLIEEIKIRNKHPRGGPSLNKALLEQLRISVKEKEDELDKYQVKLELLQMDLEDKEVSVENYADQVKLLDMALRTMETKIEESEREKEGLKQEIQALKELEICTSEHGDGNGQSPAVFNAVTKDNFNHQIDAKCLSVPHDTMPSQNDYVQLVSSLHMTMSKLNELEKMCEHLQTEKLTLASQLKDSQWECVTGTDTMVEELRNKINVVKKEHAAFSDGLDQNVMEAQFDFEKINFEDLECCTGLNYEDLKFTNEAIKAHFDGLKEKILSVKNQYKCLHEQNMNMVSKLSELQCSIEMLRKENTALSASLNQGDNISFITQLTPGHIDKEFLVDGTFCLCSSHPSSTASLTESYFDSDHDVPPNEITKHNNNSKQSELESTPYHHHSFTELHDGDMVVHTIKQGHTVTKNFSLKNKIGRLMLCETYDKSFKRLEESFEGNKNLEEEELQKIQQLLLSAREEVDCLRQQHILDNEEWQQKLHHVILEVVSQLPAKRNDSELLPQVLEEPRCQSQDMNSSSSPPICVGTEHKAQFPAEQTSNPLSPLEMYDLTSESVTSEALLGVEKETKYEANRTEDKRPDYEMVIGVKFAEECFETSVRESRRMSDNFTSPSHRPALIIPDCHNRNTIPANIHENHKINEISPLQINKTYTLKPKLSHGMAESNKAFDTLVMEIQNLTSRMDAQAKELVVKRASCDELEKTVKELENEKQGLSQTLESVTFGNQQLSYNFLSLEIELNKAKSDLEIYKVRLCDTREALEDLEMTKSDWNEKLLEAENELRRIKAERENIESHALSMEADIEELQSKKEQLEKENENKLKTIFGLQEQLHMITAERNQFSQDLSALSKDKEELNHVCQKLQGRIKDLETSHTDSSEFIRVLESEVQTHTKLLQTAKDSIAQLSAEKDCLMLQLQNLEKIASDLMFEKETAQSQVEHLSEEKEAVLREYETLQAHLNDSQTEISKISKSLEGSLIEKGELSARLNSAQEEVAQLRHGIEKLKIKIESDEKKRCRLTEKLKESARKADSLVDKIETLERELHLSEENLEDAILQAEVAKEEKEFAETELGKMHVNFGELEAEVNALKSEKDQLERELVEAQERASHLERSNSVFVKQLEEKEVQMKSEYENALRTMQSELRRAREEMEVSQSKQEMYEAKQQELMSEITSFKHDNTQLAYHLQQAKCKHSEAEELMGALIRELQEIRRQLDENDSFLEQLPRREALQLPPDDPQASCEGSEEEQENSASEMSGGHKLLEQLKNGENALYPKFLQWMRYCRMLKQEREEMVKQIHELEIQLNRPDPKEIVLELEGLRESVEEKTREAEEHLEKYCTVLIDHHKLEEENEMLRTQISLLNIQLKQSSSSAAVSGLWQSHGSTTLPKGFVNCTPGNSSPHNSHRTDLSPRTSPCLLSPNLRLQHTGDDILEMDYFPENSKPTAEGSKLQKIDDAQLQEIQATGLPLGFTPRSPLSACNQSIQPVADRSAGTADKIKTRLSKNTVENKLNEGCHVQ
ncbi:centromere protein F isoform X2 [Paroedura picta]|uniref:centromere protein F isoform X2 n=1 Tax=Paroedura picta TaxID=143630 RepID=UPI0040571D1D